jgi:PPK2 family polyphosphate:nucleotide phosphotransferase
MLSKELVELFRIKPGANLKLKDCDPGWAQTEELEELGKDEVKERAKVILDTSLAELSQAQDLLYADNRYSILVILQAMDAAGKDGTIKHVMTGVNPQGCDVHSFKQPSPEELEHNFLWRYVKKLPERGKIGIFNRSYYEDVLIVKVHPNILEAQRLPTSKRGKHFWRDRYDDINALEQHLVRNGTVIVKFFLHISKDEQKKRFLARLDEPEKHWKFSSADLTERGYWKDYMSAYEDAISETSTKHAPWYVVPADHKWVARTVVADVLSRTISSLDLAYPVVPEEERKKLSASRKKLENE